MGRVAILVLSVFIFGACASRLSQQEVRIACEGLIHEVRHKIQADKIIELNKTIKGKTLYIRRLQFLSDRAVNVDSLSRAKAVEWGLVKVDSTAGQEENNGKVEKNGREKSKKKE